MGCWVGICEVRDVIVISDAKKPPRFTAMATEVFEDRNWALAEVEGYVRGCG